jgi:hypothetical protein
MGKLTQNFEDIGEDVLQFEQRRSSMRRCQAEDDIDCFWDAQEQGNGQGTSFYSTKNPDGTVTVRYADGTEQTFQD